ncbi:MAG: ABC transporter substrate-binding protein, partial [Gammaproteobacteria bacterium]
TAGESTEETDVLELVHDSWLRAGIKLHSRPSQREVFRNRIFAGETVMAVWSGLENAIATAQMSPAALAPTQQQQFQWPKWGQFHETGGQVGDKCDMPIAERLGALNQQWQSAADKAQQKEIWHEMLKIHSEHVLTIGTINSVRQPVVVNNRLRNVPREGIYSWSPGAYFGIYQPDTFWMEEQ